MTSAQMRLEADLDEMSMMDPPEPGPNGLYAGEAPCRHCGEPTAMKYLGDDGSCDREECLENRHLLPHRQWFIVSEFQNPDGSWRNAWWTIHNGENEENYGGWSGLDSRVPRPPALFDESTARLLLKGMAVSKFNGNQIVCPSWERYYPTR